MVKATAVNFHEYLARVWNMELIYILWEKELPLNDEDNLSTHVKIKVRTHSFNCWRNYYNWHISFIKHIFKSIKCEFPDFCKYLFKIIASLWKLVQQQYQLNSQNIEFASRINNFYYGFKNICSSLVQMQPDFILLLWKTLCNTISNSRSRTTSEFKDKKFFERLALYCPQHVKPVENTLLRQFFP